jgi:glyoxylase I family protein
MAHFTSEVLGLLPIKVHDSEAAFFQLPDGSMFAVAETDGMGSARTVGFGVTDVVAAWHELREHGVEVDDEINENERYLYVHFRAPDGQVYELVEDKMRNRSLD